MQMRMPTPRYTAVAVGLSLLTMSSIDLRAQRAPIPHARGESVTPSFEGWYRNADGTFSLSFGYMNRNFEEALDIPVGPDNRIEPGPEDRGQPTHFVPRRQTGIFTIVVPRDFGSQKLTWTITAHGQTFSIPGHLRPEWEIDALKEVTNGNTPPLITLSQSAKPGRGPGGARTSLEVTMPAAATLNVWVTDDRITRAQGSQARGAGLGVVWSKYRGPGNVAFSNFAPVIDKSGKATTTATFSAPGEYVLRVLAWDDSGGQGLVMAGGFQCCWTNGYVNVSVKPAGRQNR
jgi:hypothetical protein